MHGDNTDYLMDGIIEKQALDADFKGSIPDIWSKVEASDGDFLERASDPFSSLRDAVEEHAQESCELEEELLDRANQVADIKDMLDSTAMFAKRADDGSQPWVDPTAPAKAPRRGESTLQVWFEQNPQKRDVVISTGQGLFDVNKPGNDGQAVVIPIKQTLQRQNPQTVVLDQWLPEIGHWTIWQGTKAQAMYYLQRCAKLGIDPFKKHAAMDDTWNDWQTTSEPDPDPLFGDPRPVEHQVDVPSVPEHDYHSDHTTPAFDKVMADPPALEVDPMVEAQQALDGLRDRIDEHKQEGEDLRQEVGDMAEKTHDLIDVFQGKESRVQHGSAHHMRLKRLASDVPTGTCRLCERSGLNLDSGNKLSKHTNGVDQSKICKGSGVRVTPDSTKEKKAGKRSTDQIQKDRTYYHELRVVEVKKGDQVLTPNGPGKVEDVWDDGRSTQVRLQQSGELRPYRTNRLQKAPKKASVMGNSSKLISQGDVVSHKTNLQKRGIVLSLSKKDAEVAWEDGSTGRLKHADLVPRRDANSLAFKQKVTKEAENNLPIESDGDIPIQSRPDWSADVETLHTGEDLDLDDFDLFGDDFSSGDAAHVEVGMSGENFDTKMGVLQDRQKKLIANLVSEDHTGEPTVSLADARRNLMGWSEGDDEFADLWFNGPSLDELVAEYIDAWSNTSAN